MHSLPGQRKCFFALTIPHLRYPIPDCRHKKGALRPLLSHSLGFISRASSEARFLFSVVEVNSVLPAVSSVCPRSHAPRGNAKAKGYHAERGSQMYSESQLAKTAITITNSYPPAAALHCPRSLWRWSNANVHPDQRNPALLGSDECIRSFASSSQNC